ncbi:hypothetical protein WJX73_010045 [Symbiochloris irregularis]|uniref:Uncharacterized protein n=1 Tax=Symbiochloris irregularis TaxID=706552 RepID=A0AAW1PFG9_9CHLO
MARNTLKACVVFVVFCLSANGASARRLQQPIGCPANAQSTGDPVGTLLYNQFSVFIAPVELDDEGPADTTVAVIFYGDLCQMAQTRLPSTGTGGQAGSLNYNGLTWLPNPDITITPITIVVGGAPSGTITRDGESVNWGSDANDCRSGVTIQTTFGRSTSAFRCVFSGAGPI